MLVFVKQYNLGMWFINTHPVSLLWNGSYCYRQQGRKVFGGGLKCCKLRMRVKFRTSWYEQIYSIGFFCISNLFTSWHCLLKSLSIVLAKHIQVILSALVWSQGGVDYTASPIPERWQLLELSRVQGFRSSSVPVSREGYLVESRRSLWFGSPQANRSTINTLSRQSPLTVRSVTHHVNNQPPSW